MKDVKTLKEHWDNFNVELYQQLIKAKNGVL